NGKRTLVSHDLIAGSAILGGPRLSLHADRSYSWWDGPSTPGTSYWIEERDLNGSSVFYGPAGSSPGQSPKVAATGPANSPLIHSLVSVARVHRQKLRPALAIAPAGAPAPPGIVNLRAFKAVKLAVNQTGWYRVPFATLNASGLNPGDGSK